MQTRADDDVTYLSPSMQFGHVHAIRFVRFPLPVGDNSSVDSSFPESKPKPLMLYIVSTKPTNCCTFGMYIMRVRAYTETIFGYQCVNY